MLVTSRFGINEKEKPRTDNVENFGKMYPGVMTMLTEEHSLLVENLYFTLTSYCLTLID